MTISRRLFISFLLAPTIQAEEVRASVLEIFEIDGAVKAILVNQARPDQRDVFAGWLRSHAQSRIRIQTTNGDEYPASIFRVRMCFGRGLIILDQPIKVRERDTLAIRSL